LEPGLQGTKTQEKISGSYSIVRYPWYKKTLPVFK
jgi:hypothetical protein